MTHGRKVKKRERVLLSTTLKRLNMFCQVEKQLSKDRIYYVVSRSTRETTTTQQSVLPIDEIVSQIKQQIAARKKDCNAYAKDIIIDWPFAYFI